MQNQIATRTPNYKSPNGLSIYLNEEGHTLIASFAPEGIVEMINVDDFKRSIDGAGFGECDLNEVAILEATSKYIAGESFEVAIGDAVDGEFFIQIDDDHLNAFLTCIPSHGGSAVTPESVIEEARNKIISVELDMEAVERAINENGDHVLIAHGKEPEVGHDSEFKSLLPEAKEHVPQVDEDGVANFRDLGEILIVHEGDPLMRRIPATLGEPGITISGQPIPAVPGHDELYSVKLEGVEIDPEDSDLLKSKIDGCPTLLENGVRVEPVYTIRNVDLHSGNIDFLGTVIVTGGILSGMTVKADGDIHVKGSVVGVVLIAGGDVVVGGGIIGHDDKTNKEHATHARVECNGSCTANFTQNARITAGKNILIRDFTMMSKLVAAEQVIVGDETHTGQIIGGFTTAGVLVQSGIIGAPTRSRTVVIAKTSDLLFARMAAISEAMDAAKVKLSKFVRLLDLAANRPDRVSEKDIKLAESGRAEVDVEIANIKLDEAELKNEIVISRGAHITAKKKFLEGVEVKIGPKVAKVIRDTERGTYRMKNDELIYE
jgi:uncharacterized protein (DUF342 family)